MIKFLTLLAAVALAAAAPAAAGDTLTFRMPVDTAVTISTCGFPVVRQDTGTLVFVDRFDGDGNLIFENAIFGNWRITFTNPATGANVTSTRGYVEQFVQYDDGSFLAMSAGLVARLTVPGVGLVAANVGTIRVHFDASGAPLPGSIVVGGIHDGPIARYVCPYLA
jgi:hypothetical protein